MNIKCTKIILACVVILVLFVSNSRNVTGQPLLTDIPDASDIVTHVRETLDSLQTFQCSFERLYFRAVDEWTTILRGTLALKEPSLFRYEDQAKLVVIDGVTVWMYVPVNEQVNISEFMHEDEDFPTPRNLFKQYTEHRTAEYAGEEIIDGRTMDILVLPGATKEESDVKVWIDRELGCPFKTFEEYPQGDTVQYILRDIELNVTLADSLFVFQAPSDTEVIDMRE